MLPRFQLVQGKSTHTGIEVNMQLAPDQVRGGLTGIQRRKLLGVSEEKLDLEACFVATIKRMRIQVGIGAAGAVGPVVLGRAIHRYAASGRKQQCLHPGNRFMVTGWGARQWLDWLSTSVRLDAYLWENIDGADPKLAHALRMRMVPTADPARRGGERVDAGFGVNVYIRRGALKGHRIAVEGRVPLYQSLDGPQLETDWVLAVGWQYAFAGRITIRTFPHQAVGRISEA